MIGLPVTAMRWRSMPSRSRFSWLRCVYGISTVLQ